MDDLVAFLRARLGEDERVARDAADADSGAWFMGDKWNVYRAEDEARYDEDYRGEENRLVVYGNVKPQSEHIARHDPARVLAEVAAKRAIVWAHEPVLLNGSPLGKFFEDTVVCRSCEPEYGAPTGHVHWPCLTLRHLAAVHADHPDYREEWRPDQEGLDG